MALKDSGAISKEDWPQKEESDGKNCLYILENMSGDTITKVKISKNKKIVYLCY